MEPETPPEPVAPPAPPSPGPSIVQGVVYGLFAALSLGFTLAGILALSFRTGCDPRVPCVADQAMLQHGYTIIAVMAVIFGLVMGFLAAFVMPRLSARMGSGCALVIALGIICIWTLALMVPGLDMIQRLLWG